MIDNVVAGLISGVVVTLCVVVFGKFWKAVLVPWFEDLVYKDVKIEGTWYSLYLDTKELRKETIDLKRRGHKVSGSFTCMTRFDTGVTYDFVGSFRNMILPICYESRDPSKTDRGTITLKCIWNAERLEGVTACYSDNKDKITTLHVVWFRELRELERFEGNIKKVRERLQKLQQKQEEISKEIDGIEQPALKDTAVDHCDSRNNGDLISHGQSNNEIESKEAGTDKCKQVESTPQG